MATPHLDEGTTVAASIVHVIGFNYRGVTEFYSVKQHFDGGPPADQTKWLALDTAIRADMKVILPSSASIDKTIGYAADDEPAEFLRDATTVGTLSVGTGIRTPGDCAVWVRWTTARRDSRGHPVYLRNYFHPAYATSSSAPDTILAAQKTALLALGAGWVAGYSDGDVTHKRTGPDSLGATGHSASDNIGRRKLKRRG